jgi:hypothetical protein
LDHWEFWANAKVPGFKQTTADTTAADLKNLRREMDILSVSLAGLVRVDLISGWAGFSEW